MSNVAAEFWQAADKGDAPAILGFVAGGVDVNSRDENGRTALMRLAIMINSFEQKKRAAAMLEKLARKGVVGAKKDLGPYDGLGTMQAIIELGVDGGLRDLDGNDALDHYNAEIWRERVKEDPAVIKLLKKAGAKGDEPTFRLIVATRDGDLAGARKAIADGADVNRIPAGRLQKTPLTLAAERGLVDIMGVLVEAGAQINKLDRFGTPLHGAAAQGMLEAVKWLLDHGADRNALSREDPGVHEPMTVAAMAKYYGHDKVVEFFKAQGATSAGKKGKK